MNNMEHPRDVVLNHFRTLKGYNIDIDYTNKRLYMRDHIVKTLFYVISEYIEEERAMGEYGMGNLEKTYLCTEDFVNAEDEKKWLEEHRETEDIGLMMHVYDNYYMMKPSKYRMMILYIKNILSFY